jgi:hypothetical protein
MAQVTLTVSTINIGIELEQQSTINILTDVANAQDNYVLTKDTITGNAIFKPSQGGGSGTSGSITLSFTNASLSSGTLSIQHNLNQKYMDVTVFNSEDKKVNPDLITMIDLNNLTVLLGSYGEIQGTWHIKITP